MNQKIFIVSLSLTLAAYAVTVGCKHTLLKKPAVESFNHGYTGKRFKANKDINFWENGTVDTTRLMYKKGTVLLLRLEAGDEWIRIRARDVSKNEEQNPGDVILFYTSDPDSDVTGEQALKGIMDYLTGILSPVP